MILYSGSNGCTMVMFVCMCTLTDDMLCVFCT